MHSHEKWRSIQWPVSKVVRTDSCGKNFLVGIFVNVRFCVMFTYSALHFHATFDDPDLISRSQRRPRVSSCIKPSSHKGHKWCISWLNQSLSAGVFWDIAYGSPFKFCPWAKSPSSTRPVCSRPFFNFFLMITGSWKASKNIAIFSLSVFSFSHFSFLFSGSCLNSVRMLHR